jgi:hypothetical protein
MTPSDPLGYNLALPLRSRLYPAGFALELHTNSAQVCEAAEEAFGSNGAFSAPPPAILRVHVTGALENGLPPPVMPHGQGHLLCINFGPRHFGICDVSRGYAFVSLPEDAARNRQWTAYHFLEPLGWMMIDALHAPVVHAAGVALNGRAALLCGESGAGKTSLAYACARRGWSFLSGDAMHLVHAGGEFEVRGRPHQLRFRESASRLFPELAGIAPRLRPNGKLDIVTAASGLGIQTGIAATACCLIDLRREPAPCTARISPWTRQQAMEALSGSLLSGDAELQRARQSTLEHFASLPLFQLHYSDFESAETLLRGVLGQ